MNQIVARTELMRAPTGLLVAPQELMRAYPEQDSAHTGKIVARQEQIRASQE